MLSVQKAIILPNFTEFIAAELENSLWKKRKAFKKEEPPKFFLFLLYFMKKQFTDSQKRGMLYKMGYFMEMG